MIFFVQFLQKFDPNRILPCFASHSILPSLALPVTASQDGTDLELVGCNTPMSALFPGARDPSVVHTPAAQAVAKALADRCLPLVEPPPPGVSTFTLLPGLKKRLKQSFCRPGNVTTNPVMEIFKLCIMEDVEPGGEC